MEDPRLDKAIEVFDLFAFLDEYQVDYVMEGKNVGKDYIGVNPCPNPSCNDSNNHFGIHIEKKFGTCFKCKYGMNTVGIVKWFAHLKTWEEAKKFLIDKLDEGDYDLLTRVTDIIRMEKKETHYNPPKKDPFPTDTYTITYNLLRRNKYIRKFFKDRKLYLWHVKRYNLRIGGNYSGYQGYILFPVFLRNKIVTWQARHILSKRYHNPENLGSYIYNEEGIIKNKPLILVEGFLDMSRIDSYLRRFYDNSLSITTGFTKTISKQQIQRIINSKPSKIIVIWDADSWFDYDRIKQEVPIDIEFIILPKNKDPNDLTWSELQKIFGEIENDILSRHRTRIHESRKRKNINMGLHQ